MTLTISFKANTFKNIGEALEFALAHLPFKPLTISSPKSFCDGYHDFNKNEVLEKLV